MNSNFFNILGLRNIDAGILFVGLFGFCIILLILNITAFVQITKFKRKYTKFMLGKDGANDIMTLYEDNKFMKLSIDRNRESIKELSKKQEIAFQKLGLVKYDAFTEMGGKLSFALALLDEKNNGFIINSVHSSEGCYSYTKWVKEGDSQLALSNEEKVAVERAINGSSSDLE